MKITLADLDTPIGPMRIAAHPSRALLSRFHRALQRSDKFPDNDLALLKAVGEKNLGVLQK